MVQRAAHHLCIQPGAFIAAWRWGHLLSGMLGTGCCRVLVLAGA